MKSVVRTLEGLGADVVLAPERWLAAPDSDEGVPLGELVTERRERAVAEDALVLDTTHARDGLIDVHAALRAAPSAKSAKKLACVGDVVVSRLRPYLRQIAFVHPAVALAAEHRPLALSTEFYVFAPRERGDDLAFLLPFLLGERAQAVLAAAQEGGHHPRVPRSSVLALRVPEAIVKRRRELAKDTRKALAALYRATANYQTLLGSGLTASARRGSRD